MDGIAVARDILEVRDQCLMMTSDHVRQLRCLQLLEELAMQGPSTIWLALLAVLLSDCVDRMHCKTQSIHLRP
jgi:hypothetical protein